MSETFLFACKTPQKTSHTGGHRIHFFCAQKKMALAHFSKTIANFLWKTVRKKKHSYTGFFNVNLIVNFQYEKRVFLKSRMGWAFGTNRDEDVGVKFRKLPVRRQAKLWNRFRDLRSKVTQLVDLFFGIANMHFQIKGNVQQNRNIWKLFEDEKFLLCWTEHFLSETFNQQKHKSNRDRSEVRNLCTRGKKAQDKKGNASWKANIGKV